MWRAYAGYPSYLEPATRNGSCFDGLNSRVPRQGAVSTPHATSAAPTGGRCAVLRAMTIRTRSTRELMSSLRKMCRR